MGKKKVTWPKTWWKGQPDVFRTMTRTVCSEHREKPRWVSKVDHAIK